MTIKILQINAMRSQIVMAEVEKYSEEKDIDIVLMQEPYTRKGKVRGVRMRKQIIVGEDTPGGIIIINNPEIITLKIEQCCSKNISTRQIETMEGELYLVSAYFQYAESINKCVEDLKQAIDKLPNNHLIIGVDSSARSET